MEIFVDSAVRRSAMPYFDPASSYVGRYLHYSRKSDLYRNLERGFNDE